MRVPSASETTTLDQRAVLEVPVHQWTEADGTARGVKLQALTFKDAMLAERAATDKKDGTVNPWRLVAEELASMIYDPPGINADHILKWNVDVVLALHQRGKALSGYAAAPLAAELARLAAGPPPEPRPDHGPGGAGADDVGGDAGAEAWAADEQPGASDDPGSDDGDRPPPVGDGDRDGEPRVSLAR
jgi:hypothetical protein